MARPMELEPRTLTLLEAAHVALGYAELLYGIDEGENTPELATDLARVRTAVRGAEERRCWDCPAHCHEEEAT